MPEYVLNIGGKEHVLSAEKPLSDDDLSEYADTVSAPAPAPAPKKAAAPATKEPGFGERLSSEWTRIKGAAGEVLNDLTKPAIRPASWKSREDEARQISGMKSEVKGNLRQGVATALGGEGLGGVAEGAYTMGSGMAGAAAGGIWGSAVAAKNYLTDSSVSGEDALKAGAESAESVQGAIAHQPSTPMGKITTQLAGAPLQAAKSVTGAVGGSVGRVLGNEAAGETIGENLPEFSMAGKATKDLWGARKTAGERAALTQGQKAIAKAQDAEFTAIPGKANPSIINNIVESAGGERAINAKAAIRNERRSADNIRKAFGFDAGADLNAETWKDFRKEASKSYETVRQSPGPVKMDTVYEDTIKNLDKHLHDVQKQFPGLGTNSYIENLRTSLLDTTTPKTPNGILGVISKLRNDATTMFRSSDADTVAGAYVARKAADALEAQLDRHFEKQLTPEIMANYRKARQDIAMSHDAEAAVNPVSGEVNPQVFARLLKKGRPLSGELREIGEAALAMPSVMKDTSRMSAPAGLHTSDLGLTGLLVYMVHNPKAAAAALVRPAASSLAVSKAYQATAGRPQGARTGKVPLKSSAGVLAMEAADNVPWRKQDENSDR